MSYGNKVAIDVKDLLAYLEIDFEKWQTAGNTNRPTSEQSTGLKVSVGNVVAKDAV